MNKIKKIIFIVIVLLIILLILLYIIVNNKRGEKKENEPQNQEIIEKISEGDFVASSEYIEEKNPTDYYTVKGYIDNFFK